MDNIETQCCYFGKSSLLDSGPQEPSVKRVIWGVRYDDKLLNEMDKAINKVRNMGR